jgi:hypothetical protein
MLFFKRLFARPFDPAAAAERTVAELKSALGPELVSVAAFGSWAVGEFVEGHSDLNLIVVVRRLDPEMVKRLAPTASALASAKCQPLYFSQQELKRYAEAFPLKFQDMAETRKVLHGEDPFARLEINPARLAEDLENESRRLLIKFRQRVLRFQDAHSSVLAAETISSVLPLLRGMLRLKKRKPPRQRVRVIEDACRQFRLSRRTLLQAHDLRYGRKNAGRIDADGLLDRLLSELERLADLCVKFREEEAGGPAPERHERGGEREHRPLRRAPLGGDRNKRLAEVRQLITEASQKKRWEPKEPDRFATDDLGRDAALNLATRFCWDKAWQPERRAKGYVHVHPVEPEPPVVEDEVRVAPSLSGEEAAAAAWADEVEEEATGRTPGEEAGGPGPEAGFHADGGDDLEAND